MSLPAQAGVFAFALQAAKIGRGGTFDPTAVTWHRAKAPAIAIGTIIDDQVFPLEVGGAIVPTGAFRQGVFFAGQATIHPRAEKIFGHLLKATLGAASSVTGVNWVGTTTVGVNTHIFRFSTASAFFQPWMAVRRMAPGELAADNMGETGFDCKVATLALAIPQMGPLSCQLTMMGRDSIFDDASTWTYSAAYEDSVSVPQSGNGSFKMSGVEYPLTGAVIEFNNGLTQPQQEMIIGDLRPDDFIAITRSATIRIVYKVENYDLYQKILSGAVDQATWSPFPYIESTVGGTPAFEGIFQSGTNIPTTSTPYTLRVVANRVMWKTDGPLQLQAGGIIQQSFTGTVLEPASGDYFTISLSNNATAATYA